MRTGAIGIGSNSLRMLIADITDNNLERLKRYREGLRVFAALDARGYIAAEMVENACRSVLHFRNEATEQGCEAIHLFATSAVRDAANQEEFARALLDATGLPLEICSGEEEAKLSFWGATEGDNSGLIDIGGGSTEIAVGGKEEVEAAVSLQMGAVRMSRMYPINGLTDAEHVVEKAREIVNGQNVIFSQNLSRKWVGVGGTFTTSAALAQRIPWQQREKIHGFILTQECMNEILCFLAPMPVEERLKLECMQPQRADIVVHGIAILLACMQELGISSIKVSEHGNLEGYLKRKYLFSPMS